MSIKQKTTEAKQTTTRVVKNIEELLNAVALSATTAFAGYQAYANRGKGLLWLLLGTAAAYSVIQAFIAWGKVLNKQ